MKILLAVDGSMFSEAAAMFVARRHWPAGSEVKIVSVFDPFQASLEGAMALSSLYWNELEQFAKEEAHEAVEMAIKQFADVHRLTVSNGILTGNPGEAILAEAEMWEADLLIIGLYGYPGLKRMFFNSVSRSGMTRTPCLMDVVRRRIASDNGADERVW